MNSSKAITVMGITFLFWIAVRGRFPKYSALVHSAGSASSPSGTPAGAGGGIGPSLGAAASIAQQTASKVWNGLKGQ